MSDEPRLPHSWCITEALRNGTVDPRELTLHLRAELRRLSEENEKLRAALTSARHSLLFYAEGTFLVPDIARNEANAIDRVLERS